jgi:hypothetical protein
VRAERPRPQPCRPPAAAGHAGGSNAWVAGAGSRSRPTGTTESATRGAESPFANCMREYGVNITDPDPGTEDAHHLLDGHLVGAWVGGPSSRAGQS